jgi:DNA-binding NtrC family response regulator
MRELDKLLQALGLIPSKTQNQESKSRTIVKDGFEITEQVISDTPGFKMGIIGIRRVQTEDISERINKLEELLEKAVQEKDFLKAHDIQNEIELLSLKKDSSNISCGEPGCCDLNSKTVSTETKEEDDDDKYIPSEKELIEKVLAETTTNAAAAKILGMSERTLYRRLKEYNLN